MFSNMPVVQSLFQDITLNNSICWTTVFAYKQEYYLIFLLLEACKLLRSHTRCYLYCSGMTEWSPGDLNSPSPPNCLWPGHIIVLDPAPIYPFSESSITAALYSIMVTLIKVPSPDPFPEWSLPCPTPVLRQWAMLQQGTRPHCKQAAGLFTWPNYPNPMGGCAPGKGRGFGEPTVNSSFPAGAETGIFPRTNGKKVTKVFNSRR